MGHQPNESHFWELRGHAWKMLEEYGNAEKAYTTAIKKNDSFSSPYFSPYLARGVLRYEQGERQRAQSDLQRSYELLPTQTASYYLGELSLEKSQYQQAANYFQLAAKSSGTLGIQSRQRLQDIQLQLQPQSFLSLSTSVSSSGYLLVTVRNNSPQAMKDIVLSISGSGTGKSVGIPVNHQCPFGNNHQHRRNLL